MSSRSVLLSLLVLFVSGALVSAADPFKKPAEKAKPAAESKPAVESKPAAERKAADAQQHHKWAPRPKPAPPPRLAQGVPPEAIARALEQPTQMEFIESPLSDVIEYLVDLHKIPIMIDKKAMDDIGVQADTSVTMNVKGLKLRSALNHMLRKLDLTWIIQDEALVITTPEQADATLETRVYEVADLVAVRDEQLRPYNDFAQLIDTITSTVRPCSWDTVGGPGSIGIVETTGITVLVVSQTQPVQEGVEKLLADLRKAKHPGADSAPPVRRRETEPKPAFAADRCFGQPPATPPAKPAGKE